LEKQTKLCTELETEYGMEPDKVKEKDGQHKDDELGMYASAP
jgi:hypothetical protein